MNYSELCIDKNTSLRDAMRQLDKTGKKILFVTKKGMLTAALTDGDIRRFLLSGGKMEDFVDAAANHNPKTAGSREQALSMLRKESIIAIPVTANQRITDIVLATDHVDVVLPQLGLPVVVMAGGMGTRLYPYTRVLPKPLIPIGDLPIIEHIMEQFMKYGCDDFHVIVNYKKQLIKAYFNESERSYRTSWYDEEKPLGTGGGLFLLRGSIHHTFFLTNCDVLLQSDYDDMLRFHKNNGNVITMVCAYKNLTIPYGVIEMGQNGLIKAMKEKPEMSFLINTGMYIVEPEVLDDIQDDVAIGFPDIIELQRQKGRKVAVYPVSENEWLDMGQMTELENMRKRLYDE
jgi:dTDP-glucose pyrophosphorylase